MPHREAAGRGIRSAQAGMLVNTALAVTKLVAGIVGNSYALVADAVESAADIFSSLIVWSGLSVASRDPDETYPFGYGKAESLAAAIVSLMLLGAAVGISIEAIREIVTPHHAPAAWTLAVLVGVVVVKTLLSRRVGHVGRAIGSSAVQADAWHHMSDALTSAAAFVGISVAVIGGPGFEAADDWAALVASAIIVYNGITMLRPAVADLMDRSAGPEVLVPVRMAAESVSGVLATEKLAMRRTGMTYRVTIHVQTDPEMPLHEAHILSGKVKSAIRTAVPQVQSVLVHMEPFEPADGRRTNS
ncbi:MAG: cation diffusion facilitator family transporter [Gemmatimonadetes bacterium]|nr:cation diffusion facilitator family transporter [Gemmatimonadota bacterium]